MIAELYTVYRTELLKYCCMICGNVSDAEDLLQDSGDEDGEAGMVGGMLGSFLGKLKDTQIINAAEYKM